MRIIRLQEATGKTGYSNRQLLILEGEGKFPKRFQLNPPNGRAVGWLENEVDAWIEERAAARPASATGGANG